MTKHHSDLLYIGWVVPHAQCLVPLSQEVMHFIATITAVWMGQNRHTRQLSWTAPPPSCFPPSFSLSIIWLPRLLIPVELKVRPVSALEKNQLLSHHSVYIFMLNHNTHTDIHTHTDHLTLSFTVELHKKGPHGSQITHTQEWAELGVESCNSKESFNVTFIFSVTGTYCWIDWIAFTLSSPFFLLSLSLRSE